MIDGIKAILSDNLDAVRGNPLLDFELSGKVSAETGEIRTGKCPVAKYKGLTFIDKGSVIEVKGSIHVLKNDGQHNYDIFDLSDIHLVLFELADKLSIVINNAELKNLEFGVNLEVDFPPDDFLNSVIIHKGRMFTLQSGRNMFYRECSHGQYFIKFYDKGLQHRLKKHVLRFELKFIKMEKVNRLGIRYLSDLLVPDKLEKLRSLLLKTYDEILIGDINVSPDDLSHEEAMLFASGHNPGYWAANVPHANSYAGKRKDKAYMKDIRAYRRKISRFRELLKEQGADRKKVIVGELVERTSSSLIQEVQLKRNHEDSCLELTGLKKHEEQSRLSRIDQGEANPELSQLDPLLYSDNNTSLNDDSARYCLVTGLDISMQKDTSKYLCTEGVKYYKENEPEVWEQLQNRLSPKWKDAPIDKKIAEIHHSIRNENNNKIHNTRRSIKKVLQKPSLFDNYQLIREDKLALAGMV